MTDNIIRIMEAADSGWPVVALFVVILGGLGWKYGAELLRITKQNQELAMSSQNVALANKRETEHISDAIITNHGSKNIGDAIDRLTEWMAVHMVESTERSNDIIFLKEALGEEMQMRLTSDRELRDDVHSAMTELRDYIHRNAEVLAFGRKRLADFIKSQEQADGTSE